MPARKGLLAPQNTFLDTIATRFDGTHSNFVLGNAKIAKVYPIVYCSDGFCELTGYSRAHIMQKSCACNFLYGLKTEPANRRTISEALCERHELKLEVILYKSSGTPFWCLLDIVPIQDEKHEVVLFLCSYKDITKQKLHEQQQHQLAQLQAQRQQQLLDRADSPATGHAQQAGGQAGEQSDCDLGDRNEAQLTALANQNALISMDEFGLVAGDEADELELESGEDSDNDKHTANQYSRRRSRAVLYQLSGHYGYRRSVNMKSKLKLNNRMNLPEYKTTTIEKQRFILSHYGVGKSCWDWLILVVSFYVAIVVPYNATFKEKQQDLSGECKIDSIDILVEVVFVIDVMLNFRTTFVNRKGEVVTRPKVICRHYVRGWFVVDACAALPFDLLCSLNLYSRSRLDLNLLKLIRLLRLARLLQKMDRYSQYSYIILTLLMLIFSLLAHWCACIWYVIAMQEIESNPPEWKIGWIHQLSDKLGYSVVNATDMASAYVTALYFTTSSLTSVGFGNVSANTNAEKIFSIVIMLIGALMHAVVFGNVTALIRVMYARRSNYQTRLRDLKDFFRLHQLPKELQQRMSDYFQTTWSLNHGIETYEILKDFPEELRGDVSLHLHREVLSLPIFETAPQGFLKSLARHIESKFCCPTEYLIHRGDALNYLYLVCNGSMEVLQDNMVVAILGKGDLVGYDVNANLSTPEHTQFGLSKLASGLLASGLAKSSSDLKALTYCDLKCIHISGLLDVLKLYPEFSDIFQREIIHDLSFNLRDNHDEQTDAEETDEESPAMLANGNYDDYEDEEVDEDDDDDSAERQRQQSQRRDRQVRRGEPDGGTKSPPPGNLNRSFNAAGTRANQIGRYDHELDEQADEEEGELVEVEEEEEDEEEEEEDSDTSSDLGKQGKPEGGDDEDGANGGSSHQSAPLSGGNSIERTDLDLNRDQSGTSEQNSGQREGSTSGSGNQRQQRRLVNMLGEVLNLEQGETDVSRLRKDCDSLHSYDGILEPKQSEWVRAPKPSILARGEERELTRTSGRLEEANNNSVNANTPRLRSAFGNRNSSQPHQAKPPLSFDLSRNTTTIVGRRRKSAGSIVRPLSIGAVGERRTPANHSSSLIHINEEKSIDTLDALRRKHPRQTTTGRMGALSGNGKAQTVIDAHRQLRSTSQEIRYLDAQMSDLSSNMNELKLEVRREMSQFRKSIQLLMQTIQAGKANTGSKYSKRLDELRGPRGIALTCANPKVALSSSQTIVSKRNFASKTSVFRAPSSISLPTSQNSTETTMLPVARVATATDKCQAQQEIQSSNQLQNELKREATNFISPVKSTQGSGQLSWEAKPMENAQAITESRSPIPRRRKYNSCAVLNAIQPVQPSQFTSTGPILYHASSSANLSQLNSDNDSGQSSSSLSSSTLTHRNNMRGVNWTSSIKKRPNLQSASPADIQLGGATLMVTNEKGQSQTTQHYSTGIESPDIKSRVGGQSGTSGVIV